LAFTGDQDYENATHEEWIKLASGPFKNALMTLETPILLELMCGNGRFMSAYQQLYQRSKLKNLKVMMQDALLGEQFERNCKTIGNRKRHIERIECMLPSLKIPQDVKELVVVSNACLAYLTLKDAIAMLLILWKA
jgi:hypothetical protein